METFGIGRLPEKNDTIVRIIEKNSNNYGRSDYNIGTHGHFRSVHQMVPETQQHAQDLRKETNLQEEIQR